ncbi:hypothetical protein GCM10027589_55590 [Actinocorallia lasiicapitis]
MRLTLRIVGQTVLLGFADLRAVYTWRTWTFGWLARLLCQASFFALVGRFVGDDATMRFVLVGNIVMVACLEGTIVIISLAGERANGTLPLLATAPAGHLPLYLARGLHWLATGMTSSLVAWAVLPPLLGVPLPWPQALHAVPVFLVIGLSSYCYGAFLAGISVRVWGVDWIVLNLAYGLVMVFCGVDVPTTFWPAPIEAVTGFLPLTHGLHAVREVLAGASAGDVLADVGLEALVGLGWFALAAVSMERLVASGRRNGTLTI